MKVPLKELPGHRSVELSPAWVEGLTADLPMRAALGADAGPAGHGKAELDFYIEGLNVFGRGELNAVVELACSRCLASVQYNASESLTLTYLPEGQVPSLDSDELDEEDDNAEAEDTYAYEGEELNLEPMLRERLLLAIPYAPLCKEDCLGLCTKCGANLNDSECGCDRKVIDPRLAGLKNIKV